MTSVASFITLAAVAGLTLCPAWISHPQSGNLYGPLFSVVNGAYVITSLPSVVGWFTSLLASTMARGDDYRKVYTAFLMGCFGSILATLVTPSLGLVPEAGIFAAGYVLILALGAVHFFPAPEPNPFKCFDSANDDIADKHYTWVKQDTTDLEKFLMNCCVTPQDDASEAEAEETDNSTEGTWRNIPVSQ